MKPLWRLGSLGKQSREVRTGNYELFALFLGYLYAVSQSTLGSFSGSLGGNPQFSWDSTLLPFFKKVIITPHPPTHPLLSSSITSLDTRRTEAFSSADVSSLVFQPFC
jgi:hypothetical protein